MPFPNGLRLLCLLLVCSVTRPLCAAEEKQRVNNEAQSPAGPALEIRKSEPRAPYWFSYFEISAFGAYQSRGGYAIAPHASWHPTLRIRKDFSLRASFSLTALKNANPAHDRFLVVDGQLWLSLIADKGILELGGGYQGWMGNGGFRPVASGTMAWPLHERSLPFLERAFLGYSLYFTAPRLTHEARIGVGVAF